MQQVRKSPVHPGHGHMLHPAGTLKSSQLPRTQTWSTLQLLPQPPQFSGSDCVLMHELPQVRVLPGQVATHVPAAQRGVPPPQVAPVAPHARGSVIGSTHPPPAPGTVGGRHTHEPDTQYSVSLQVFPGVPQFCGSREVSTQRPPTIVRPAGQLQTPLVHMPPGKQLLPQRPQFETSVVTSTHDAPHARRLPPQSQAPETQVAVAGQRLPQRPQFTSSLETSTQAPPHEICPTGQAQTPLVHVPPAGQSLPQRPQLVSSLEMSTHAPPQTI